MALSLILPAAGAAAVAWFASRVYTARAQRDVEHRLRDADAHLHALIDHSSAAIYLKDRQRRYLLANRRHTELWPEMWNFQPGMKPSDFFPAEIARAFGESDDMVWRSGEDYTFEEDIPHPDGPRTYVSSKFPVRNAKGAIIAVGGISTDVTDLKRAHASLARKESLLRRLIEVQEAEKRRLCHEFHDGLIQYAVGSKMLLESLDRGRLPADCVATVDAVIAHLASGLEDGRRVIRGIRPAALDDLGLAAALEELCEQPWPAGTAVDAEIDPAVDEVDPGLQTTVYRIVQESLSNACRHSGAERVRVVVRRDDAGIDVVVADGGRGFDPGSGGSMGFGLIGIEERVRLAGGALALESAPGAGTQLTVHLPVA